LAVEESELLDLGSGAEDGGDNGRAKIPQQRQRRPLNFRPIERSWKHKCPNNAEFMVVREG
jgi:hypothetical protein